LLDEVAGFEAMWEQREKAHDAALAEVTKERDFYRLDAERHAQFADSYRAQLSSDKREALVPCRECAGSGLVPATPLPAPDPLDIALRSLATLTYYASEWAKYGSDDADDIEQLVANIRRGITHPTPADAKRIGRLAQEAE
jgi:hypothetical protein